MNKTTDLLLNADRYNDFTLPRQLPAVVVAGAMKIIHDPKARLGTTARVGQYIKDDVDDDGKPIRVDMSARINYERSRIYDQPKMDKRLDQPRPRCPSEVDAFESASAGSSAYEGEAGGRSESAGGDSETRSKTWGISG